MTITLTENASRKILNLIQEDPNPNLRMFRIMVSGGGCAGFQYSFSLENATQSGDQIFEDKGVTLVVDDASLPLLAGVEIDYVEELIGSSFRIKNPQAISSCGCGISFSI